MGSNLSISSHGGGKMERARQPREGLARGRLLLDLHGVASLRLERFGASLSCLRPLARDGARTHQYSWNAVSNHSRLGLLGVFGERTSSLSTGLEWRFRSCRRTCPACSERTQIDRTPSHP